MPDTPVGVPVQVNLEFRNNAGPVAPGVGISTYLPIGVAFTDNGSCTGGLIGGRVLVTCDPVNVQANLLVTLDLQVTLLQPGQFEIAITGLSAEGDPLVVPVVTIAAD